MKRLIYLFFLLSLLLTACSRKEESMMDGAPAAPAKMASSISGRNESAQAADAANADPAKQAEARRYLAYEHSVSANVTDEKLKPVAEKLKQACESMQGCDVLLMSVEGGEMASADLKLRAQPTDIPKLIALAGQDGELISRRTSAEDLSAQVADNARQLDMKLDFRHRLEGLRDKAGNNIEALIKVNEQLVEVQSDIETLTGERKGLMKRIDTEILNVHLFSYEKASLWKPVNTATKDFIRNIVAALGAVMTFIAFALPWIVFLAMCIWLFKKYRQYRRRSAKAN